MVSLFEKPKFRDFVKSLPPKDKKILVQIYNELLHGKEKPAFEQLVDFLAPAKLAKWTLLTVIQAYYRPKKEVFVKPTWDFYKNFRQYINDMKKETSPDLAPNNPAYCGFLMMSLGS